MHHAGLFKAIRYFGTQQKLARAICVTQQAISRWLCHDPNIPYAQVVKIIDATQGYVSLRELAPLQKAANQAIERLITTNTSLLADIPPSLVIEGEQRCPVFGDATDIAARMTPEELGRPVVVDSHNQLITCACRLRAHRFTKNETIKVCVLDIEEALRAEHKINPLILDLPISERVAVMMALERGIGQRRGRPKYKLISPLGDELTGRTDSFFAEKLGLGSKNNYRRAKQVVNQGIPALVRAMNQRLLPMTLAAEIAQLNPEQQVAAINEIRAVGRSAGRNI